MRSAVVAACHANHAITIAFCFRSGSLDALVEIDVGVMHADVVVLVLLDRIEAGHAGGTEAQMIGGADALEHVPAQPEILQRLDPPVEQRLRRLARLGVPPVDRPGRRIDVEVDDRLVARVLVGVPFEVLLHVGLRAEQPLFLAAPQRDADRPLRLRADRLQDPHRLHDHRRPVGVVRRAGAGMPRVEMRADQHDLRPELRVGAGDLGDDVVGVGIVGDDSATAR